MKKIIHNLFLTAVITSASVSAYGQQFDQIFFFGDSLTDVGNIQPFAPWTNGHGPLWSNDLAAKYGLSIKPSDQGGTDYARFGYTSSMMLADTNAFVANNPNLNSNALFTTWIGNNDLLNVIGETIDKIKSNPTPGNITAALEEFPGLLEDAIQTGVPNIVGITNALNKNGAKYQMVLNIPNLGALPLENLLQADIEQLLKLFLPPEQAAAIAADIGNALRFSMDEAANSYNENLRIALNKLPYDIIQVDIFSLMNVILQNPQRFGLNNITGTICANPLTDQCDQTTNLDPNTTLFWDDVHPSQVGHSLIADAVFSYLQGPTMYSLLSRAPVNVIQAQYNNINTQLLPYQNGVPAVVGEWRVFTSGNFSPQQPGTIDTTKAPSYKAYNQNITIGAMYNPYDSVTVGAAFGPSFGRTKVDGSMYQFDMIEPTLTMFGQVRPWRGHATLLVSYGLPTYHKIKRSVHIGPAVYTSNDANTRGHHFAAATSLGFNLYESPKFTVGPVSGIEYQYITVGGYQEQALMDGLNLDYFDQKHQTLTSNIGLQGTFKTPVNTVNLLFNAEARYNYQHLDGNRDIRFGTVSLPGSHGAVPVSFPKGGYGTAGGAIGAEFANKIRLFVTAMSVFGSQEFAQQVYGLAADFPLG